MECRIALDTMLEAEPAALSPDAVGELPEHLRACASCAAAADRIRGSTHRLAGDLRPAPVTAPPAAARVPRARPFIGAALAAAAGVALLLFLDVPRTANPDLETPDANASAVPAVTVPPGHNAMVFRTADPTITVIWYY